MACFESLPAELLLEGPAQKHSVLAVAETSLAEGARSGNLSTVTLAIEAVGVTDEAKVALLATPMHPPKDEGSPTQNNAAAATTSNFDFINLVTYYCDDGDDWDPRAFGTALHYACMNGHIEVVEYLLDNGASHAVKTEWLPLHLAICNKHVELARALIDKDASFVVSRSRRPEPPILVTVLQCAVANGLVSFVKELGQRWEAIISRRVQSLGHDHNSESEDDGMPDEEEFASEAERIMSDPDLIANPEYTANPTLCDSFNHSAIHYVSLCPEFESVRAIIGELEGMGVFPNDIDSVDENGPEGNPLLLSCKIGGFSAALVLLHSEHITSTSLVANCLVSVLCFDDNSLNWRPEPPGWYNGSENGKRNRLSLATELSKILSLQKFWDTRILHLAARNGLASEVSILIDLQVPDIDEVSRLWDNVVADAKNVTPSMAAASRHHATTVSVLLNSGAAVDKQNARGRTALDLSIRQFDKTGFEAADIPCDAHPRCREANESTLAKAMGQDAEDDDYGAVGPALSQNEDTII
ncbi:hypothetical protein OQA88_7163 [Cercophora sp. LCS_1]